MQIALFGIEAGGLNAAVSLLILFLVIVYLALIYWAYQDAKLRVEDQWWAKFSALVAAVPFVGVIIYTILRPPEYLDDARERELEIRAAELRVSQLRESVCPNCEHPVERTFLRCPACRVRLKDPCSSCSQPIDPRWTVCPYCETPQQPSPPPRSSPRTKSGTQRERRPQRSGTARSAKSAKPGSSKPRQASSSRDNKPSKSRSTAASRSASRTGTPPPARGEDG